MEISKEQLSILANAARVTKDYADYPHTHKGTTAIEKAAMKAINVLDELSESQKQLEKKSAELYQSISYSVYRDFLIDKTKSMEETAELLYRDQTYIDGIKNGMQNMRTHIKNGFKLHCS